LSFPSAQVAAIDLADNRGGFDVLVTGNRNRFSGYLEDKSFVIEPGPSIEPIEARREKVLKVVFRSRADEVTKLTNGSLVMLRNGDFFTGTLLTDRFRREDTGAELRWPTEGLSVVSFPQGTETTARLHFDGGAPATGSPAAEDLEFQLDLGPRLTVYVGRIEEIRRSADLPESLFRRIGALPAVPGSAPVRGVPDPEVVPREGMIWLPPGEFTQGSPIEEKDRDLDEGPQTRVVIPAGFWIGQHEVTQAEYAAVAGQNPSQYLGDPSRPVEKVNWREAVDFCRRLTERERAAGHLPERYAYRLPTEAEWEYACRAGTTTRFSHGDDPGYSLVMDYAWIDANSDSASHPVGQKKPNAWGLHDVHGNVWEWCLDTWRGVLPGGTVTNAIVAPEGTLRVARGGSWLYSARFSRSANRDSYGLLNRCSDVGFRVVLALP
jgi:formylglycine-generating enzyme required for sulfatase activity